MGRPVLDRKYTDNDRERYGYFPDGLPKGSLWIHAVSVGEVQSAYPFVRAVCSSSFRGSLLLSTITQTGRAMADQLLRDFRDRVSSIYYPWDAPSVVNRALTALQPRCYVNMETEIWPEMVCQLRRRGIPLFLVNGRLSETSFQKYRRLKGFWKKVINQYTMLLVRNCDDSRRFAALGVDPRKIHVTGDCKVDALMERRDAADEQVRELRKQLGAGPMILAGSTHEGEETIVLQAYQRVSKFYPEVRLLLVPRHPERAPGLLDQAAAVAPSCLMSHIVPDWKILLVDRIGVLFPLYGLVESAFIGGSLVPKGGQNIMEPAIWGIPFCQGSDFRDFQEPTRFLQEKGLCTIVEDGSQMADFFLASLRPGARDCFVNTGKKLLASGAGASKRSWALIDQFVSQNFGWR